MEGGVYEHNENCTFYLAAIFFSDFHFLDWFPFIVRFALTKFMEKIIFEPGTNIVPELMGR